MSCLHPGTEAHAKYMRELGESIHRGIKQEWFCCCETNLKYRYSWEKDYYYCVKCKKPDMKSYLRCS